MTYTPEQHAAAAEALARELPMPADVVHAVAGVVLAAIEEASPIVDLTTVMTSALNTYTQTVEVAAGVKNRALAEGFSEEQAQMMGQTCFLKIMGVVGG